MRAVELEQELDAGVDGPVAQAAVLTPPDQDGARAAVPFFADDLRPGGALVIAQEARNGLERHVTADAVRNAVDVDQERVAHAIARILLRGGRFTTETQRAQRSSVSSVPLW
jgi:hypothetical protein